MRSFSSPAAWKFSQQQDCQELHRRRAGTMPVDRACPQNNTMPLRSCPAPRASSPWHDNSLPFRGFPDRRAALAAPNSSVRQRIKRWDGIQRATTVWDSLRRDPELWFPSGDCLIHFYGSGQSRRGPALRVSLAYMQSSGFHSFLDQYPPEPILMSPTLSDGESRKGSLLDITYEVYVPAPSHLSREDAFRYHLTTRNLVAWMYDLPVVGEHLGEALLALRNRVNELRPNQVMNEDEMLAYLTSQDYVDFRNCPDHALALLNLAEACQNRDLWTEAFVHCAGMYDDLTLSGEFELVSRSSKALILRAHLEMDLRLEHAGRSLGSFLEHDLSSTYLGFGHDAEIHLERFRSFLHSFYVGQYGYWPSAPVRPNCTAFSKSTYRTMYFDFRNLYDYLVDSSSSGSIQDNRPADGGICVLQNIQNFDKRNKYASLPHPLPLVPECHSVTRPSKSGGMRMVFGKRPTRLDRRTIALTALSAATNSGCVRVMGSPLVKEYRRFEESWTMKETETISCSDARKVRWILIYSILQTLISVTRAPIQVRDTEGISYPLCCQVASQPPWRNRGRKFSVEEGEGDLIINTSRHISCIEPDIDYRTCSRTSSVIIGDTPPALPMRCRVSAGHELTIRTPNPRRSAASCDILDPEYGEAASNERTPSDPSTAASSADGAMSGGGWSSTSSEDGMEHRSVRGSALFHNPETDLFQEKADDWRELRALAKRISRTQFRSVTWGPKENY